MLNFTVGPVEMNEEIRQIGSEPIPYFRTDEFSQLILENEELINKFTKSGQGTKTVFLTGSGTMAMEAAVINVFNKSDRVLIINGGSFGQRFVDICTIHGIPYTELKLPYGGELEKSMLKKHEDCNYTGVLVNVHETSTGVYYDMTLVSEFCKKNNLILVVDAISSFLADEFKMKEWNIDVTISSSQKALALPPGISMVTMSPRVIERIKRQTVSSMYLDLKTCILDANRGQTPYTPAVGILIQLNKRLKLIDTLGVDSEIKKTKSIAQDFRAKISSFPFEIFSKSLSNAMTPLMVREGTSAFSIFNILKNDYQIYVCPNGGELKDKVFRVGHIGDLSIEDNDKLIEAFSDMRERKVL